MKLVTVATHSERYFPYLKLSAEKHGHELVVLGWGEKWQGFAWKFQLMKSYLESVASDEVVCFVDAYDVVVLQDPKTIEGTYLECVGGDTDKIFISREQYSHNGVENSILSFLQSFVFTKCKNEYINTGTYIGTALSLLGIFSKLCDEFSCDANKDDQRLLQDYCVLHNDTFVIDEDCELFLVINSTISSIKPGEYNITIQDGQLTYKNDTHPAFFHGNGYTDFDYIIKELGYDTTIFKADGESKTKYVWSRLVGFMGIAFERIWFWLLIFVCIILYTFRKSMRFMPKSRGYRFFR